MNKQFSAIVYTVISRAIDLKDRLDQGEHLDIAAEHHQLAGMIRGEGEGRRLRDYIGDGVFLGARYALACWVDELFIIHCQPPWADQWKDKTIEDDVFHTMLAATKFWEQADIVLQRPGAPRSSAPPGSDAVETFFLCVALGFRGTHFDDPTKVSEYAAEMRAHLAHAPQWQPPRDLGVKTNVDPLLGRATLRRVVGIYGGVALAVLLGVMVLLQIL
jgi:type VI protein secretion system component VasF